MSPSRSPPAASSPLPAHPSRVRQIPAEAYDKLSALPHQARQVEGALWINPAGPYRTLADLWDE